MEVEQKTAAPGISTDNAESNNDLDVGASPYVTESNTVSSLFYIVSYEMIHLIYLNIFNHFTASRNVSFVVKTFSTANFPARKLIV